MSPDRAGEISQQPTFEIPRDKSGRIRWVLLKEEPEALNTFIESQARLVIAEGVELTSRSLVEAKRGTFLGNVIQYYPGKLPGLREVLAIDPPGYEGRNRKDPPNIKVPRTGAGAISWVALRENPEQLKAYIEWVTQSMIADGIALNRNGFRQVGRLSMMPKIIAQDYPNGMRGLKEKFGLMPTKQPKSKKGIDTPQKKPSGYWNPENTRKEVMEFYQREGSLTHALLRKKGQIPISAAITHYPGGMYQLRVDLGLSVAKKPNGYWDNQIIEREALLVLQDVGSLSFPILRSRGQTALAHVINRNYPGGMPGLREKLGLQEKPRKPFRYWKDPENVEREARIFYEKYNNLSTWFLRMNKAGSLAEAIRTYPGGEAALRKKIDLTILNQELDIVSPEEANDELAKLIEAD